MLASSYLYTTVRYARKIKNTETDTDTDTTSETKYFKIYKKIDTIAQ